MKYYDSDVEFHCEDCPMFLPIDSENADGICDNGKGLVDKTNHCGWLYRKLKEKDESDTGD